MPVIAISSAPAAKLDKPSFVLNHDATDPIHLICAVRRVDHSGRQESEDVETACNPGGEAPGATTESLIVEVLNSFGAAGVFNVLKPLQYSLVTFAWLWDGGAANSEANPELSGSCYVPFIPMSANQAVAKYGYPALEFKISGEPVVTTSGTPVYAGHTNGS